MSLATVYDTFAKPDDDHGRPYRAGGRVKQCQRVGGNQVGTLQVCYLSRQHLKSTERWPPAALAATPPNVVGRAGMERRPAAGQPSRRVAEVQLGLGLFLKTGLAPIHVLAFPRGE